MPRKHQEISLLESAPGIQNKIFRSHFLSSLRLPSNIGLSPLSWKKVEFLFQTLQSLVGETSSRCSHWGSQVLITLLFRLSSPDRSNGFLSLSLSHFHVVLREKLAIWQWLLHVLLVWLVRMHAGSERSTKIWWFCWDFLWGQLGKENGC